MTLQQRYDICIERFGEYMPEAHTELVYTSPYQLLVAVILSAQCTDKRVNLITPALFEAFPTPAALAEASTEEVFDKIRSVSYPNNKTRLLRAMARRLVDEFDSQVPDDMDALLSLPGVGRKTANVILSVLFDRPAMAVDTHVFRVAARLGLTPGCKTPLDTERTLVKHIPEQHVATAHHWLILHGRYVCKARKPLCGDCFLCDICPSATK
ncbi:MAG: endonuclease III [Muribaculaceae bacterium]